jgi:isoleucyl-tRNA synthetase
LKEEGIARELINRIQNLRKDSGFEVTDKIRIHIQSHEGINAAVAKHQEYISAQTLAREISLVDACFGKNALSVDLDDEVKTLLEIEKV